MTNTEYRKISDLRANPLNPRGPVVDDEPLRELAHSIREKGLLQPVLITPENVIVAGHRRVAACEIADVVEIPVVIKELDEAAQIEIMLVENLQRQDLNPLQIGKAAMELRQRGLTVASISSAIGMCQERIKTYLTIAQFPTEIHPFFATGQLKLVSVSALAEVSPKEQIYWANRAVNAQWGGSQLCSAIRQRKRGKAERMSDDDMRQQILSGVADNLFKIADNLFKLAERIEYWEDLKPIAEQVSGAGDRLIDVMRKRGKSRKVA